MGALLASSMDSKLVIRIHLLFIVLFFFFFLKGGDGAGDEEPLLALKSAIDPLNSLAWNHSGGGGGGGAVCGGAWMGVKDCTAEGRVSKLVLELLNLTGELRSELLAPLNQLRVLSLKSNALHGPLPDFSSLPNLKILYLSNNRFSGRIPATFAALHRLKILVVSNNLLAGDLPTALTTLPRLYTLLLDNNNLTGEIPAFKQQSLRYFNVSNNDLSGEVPATRALSQFNVSSFVGNPRLCGGPTAARCPTSPVSPPSLSPVSLHEPSSSRRNKNKKKIIAIVAGSVGGFVILCILVLLLAFAYRAGRKSGSRSSTVGATTRDKAAGEAEETGGGDGGGGGFSWERSESQGKLVFVGGAAQMYGMEDLLRASAETLGRGTVGSTYKAVMESGYIVTVKRLRHASHPGGAQEFRRRSEELGALRHPNVVPLRAYFQAKEECLLVYDYFPNGSLFSLIHGSRPSGSGKPLHWTSCLKIAEDVAAGLLYLHQSSPAMLHGNLKSSNVLLGPDFESCLTDYGLVPFFRPSSDDDPPPAASLFYRAPESRPPRLQFTQQSDIYSFGVLLLELLTGKTPFQDLVEDHGADIPRWVRGVREDEAADQSGDERNNSTDGEEKLNALLVVAMACVSAAPDRRPATREALRMIREARAEAIVSSNSSDHSPGRWSDTVQSLPREYGSEHMNFAERD